MTIHHLDSLRLRLSKERGYMATAKSTAEKKLRAVFIRQIEKEIAGEMAFLGKADNLPEMSDDELLAALNA